MSRLSQVYVLFRDLRSTLAERLVLEQIMISLDSIFIVHGYLQDEGAE